jgi:hypothetical protein
MSEQAVQTPQWLLEIKSRADAATKGPWTREEDDDNVYHDEKWILEAASSIDAEFCARARIDVPRMVGLVEDMAGALEAVKCFMQMTERDNIQVPFHISVMAHRAAYLAQQALAKYHGEANKP